MWLCEVKMGCENKEKMPLEREESYFSAASFLNFLIKYIFLGRTTEKNTGKDRCIYPGLNQKVKNGVENKKN